MSNVLDLTPADVDIEHYQGDPLIVLVRILDSDGVTPISTEAMANELRIVFDDGTTATVPDTFPAAQQQLGRSIFRLGINDVIGGGRFEIVRDDIERAMVVGRLNSGKRVGGGAKTTTGEDGITILFAQGANQITVTAAGSTVGLAGPAGLDGQDGAPGADGADGQDGTPADLSAYVLKDIDEEQGYRFEVGRFGTNTWLLGSPTRDMGHNFELLTLDGTEAETVTIDIRGYSFTGSGIRRPVDLCFSTYLFVSSGSPVLTAKSFYDRLGSIKNLGVGGDAGRVTGPEMHMYMSNDGYLTLQFTAGNRIVGFNVSAVRAGNGLTFGPGMRYTPTEIDPNTQQGFEV